MAKNIVTQNDAQVKAGHFVRETVTKLDDNGNLHLVTRRVYVRPDGRKTRMYK